MANQTTTGIVSGTSKHCTSLQFVLIVIAALYIQPASAFTRSYDPNSPSCSGQFSDSNCWLLGFIPSNIDLAYFNTPDIHTVTFTSAITNQNLYLDDGDVTFDLGAFNYTLTQPLTTGVYSISLGDTGTASLELTNGTVTAVQTAIGTTATGDGALLVNSGAELVTSDQLIVGSFGTGDLQIVNSGLVTQTSTVRHGYIGDEIGSTGTATVSGTGSLWDVAAAIIVGDEGNGSLTINSGGVVNTANGSIGSQATGVGTVLITGTGSQWNNTAAGGSTLGIGSSGDGTLTISNGGSFTNDGTDIARNAGSFGDVIVDGVGSTYTDTDDILVGEGGTGTMTVRNGASASADLISVGFLSGSSGTLSIESGGQLTTSASGIVGDRAGSTGSATMTGTGSRWDSVGSIAVGRDGNGSLSVLGGGGVTTAGGLRIGLSGSAVGVVTVDGSGSSITVTNDLEMGAGGSATSSLTISNGGSVSSSSGEFTRNAAINIFGSNSQLLISGNITDIGNGGFADADILVSAGGLLSNTNSSFNDTSTITVDGTGSQWINTGTLNLDIGTLTVQNGGSVLAGDTTMNNDLAAQSSRVDGTGSALHVGSLFLGDSGTTSLVVENGATLTSESTIMGDNLTGNGTITVTGTGSSWTDIDTVWLGWDGAGTLDVLAGGTASLDSVVLAAFTGSSGALTVDGTGSALNTNDAVVGGVTGIPGGTGTFTVSNGATANIGNLTTYAPGTVTVDGGSLQVTNYDASNGTFNFLDGMVTIDNGIFTLPTAALTVDSGTGNPLLRFDNGGTTSATISTLTVADSGSGSVEIAGGSVITSNSGTIGNATGSTGTATVDGLGSSWTNTGSLVVGNSGTGALDIINGASVSTQSLSLGVTYSTGTGGTSRGNGSITIEGAGSTLNSDTLYVGEVGIGTIDILNGGSMGSGLTNIGWGFPGIGSSGTVTVDGSGSSWLSSGDVLVGGDGGGDGTLNIRNGGAVTNAAGYIGSASGSIGTATVDGAGSTWTNSSSLTVGDAGNGILNIQNGGNVSSSIGSIGAINSGNGAVLVDGTNSTWTVSGGMLVGNFGTGSLDILNGGSVSSLGGIVGGCDFCGSPGIGTVTVDGAGSSWTITDSLQLNSTGNATIDILNGGTINTVSGDIELGFGNLGDSAITVMGAGSNLTSGDSLFVGGNNTFALGNGTLTVNSGGTVNVTNHLKVWDAGTVDLNGGTINTASLERDNGSINFNAGALNLTASGLLVDTGGVLGSAIDLDSLKTLGVSGTTTLNGIGTLTLNGGTFSTGSLVDNGGFAFNSGTFNLTSDNLAVGAGGLFGSVLPVSFGKTMNVTNTTTVDAAGLLYVNGGSFWSGNLINNGQVAVDGLTSNLGGAISNNGLLNGDGRISAVLTNNTNGEVRIGNGDALRFSAAGNTNSGEINLLGGEVEFTQDLTNVTGGVITGNGTLIADSGLTNRGNIGLSGGATNVYGDVNNDAGGTIILSGSGAVTFYDDLVHNGTEIRVSSGSNAVFFGAVSGAGSYTGTGSLFFEGDLNPGNSPGLVSVEGDMTLGLSSHTIMEIAGLGRGTEYDAFDIGGDLWLGGALEVSLPALGTGLFDPQLGDSFDLFAADTISGDFDLLMLAGLGGGLGWEVNVLADAIGGITDVVSLSVVTSTVPIPPSVWLFGSGLLGLIGVARRRAA